ncbi:DUF4347 domain-containing protein [Flagellimonas sp.]|uniref:DUF4347 domain-containing protein n=1 Tax=Flagellimonas sp. TaxID=2058762 RepID=UPI003AB75424
MKNPFYRKTFTIFLLLCTVMVSGVIAQSNDLVVMIDSKYSQKQQVLGNLPLGTVVFEIGTQGNPWQQIREYMEQNRSTVAIHLFANASYNALQLGNTTYALEEVEQELELPMLEGLYQGNNIQLLIYDCNLGSNPEGLSLLKKISERAYFNIAVPTHCNSIFGSNLVFDHTTMNQTTTNSIFIR